MLEPDPQVYTRAELLRRGLTRTGLRRLVARGTLVRIRRGWYARPGARQDVRAAVAAGGCLTCVSALAYYGIWVPDTAAVHVRLYHGGPGSVAGPGFQSCAVPHERGAPQRAVDSLPDALAAAAGCLDAEGVVVVLDSILNLALMTIEEVSAALAGCPKRVQRLVRVCRASQSGTETMVRLRLARRRVRVRTQVWIESVGFVDLLVGSRLVVEVDSRAHHTDATAYQSDRNRDRRLQALGYLIIRLTYADVVHRWDTVEEDVLALIRRREHRRRLAA